MSLCTVLDLVGQHLDPSWTQVSTQTVGRCRGADNMRCAPFLPARADTSRSHGLAGSALTSGIRSPEWRSPREQGAPKLWLDFAHSQSGGNKTCDHPVSLNGICVPAEDEQIVKREARPLPTDGRNRPPQIVALPGFQLAPESREGLRATRLIGETATRIMS